MLTLSPVRPSGRVGRDVMVSRVERLVVAPDAPLAERNAALRGEIGGDARALGDAIAQRDHARNLLLEPLHALGEAVAQALDDLEQAEVDIGEPAAGEPWPAALRQDHLEITEELWHAITPEIPGTALCRGDLLLEIEPACHRVMRVVDFDDEVRDGELQLMQPQPLGLVLRGEPKPRAEPVQDQRGLRDGGLAGLQDRRGERRMLLVFAIDQPIDRAIAALARDIDVVGARLFQREPDELTDRKST